MNLIKHPAFITVSGVIIVALIITGTILYTKHQTNATLHTAKTVAHSSKESSSKSTNNTTHVTSSTSGKASTESTASPADRAVAANSSQPVTEACKLLSVSIAQQIVGSDAQVATANSTSASPAADTTITSCAYTGSKGSVQLTVRATSGQLGTSENDTAFGSNKPTGAVAVSGYGQSAFWNPGTHELDILGSNNWYIIARSTNSQTDTESVAKLLSQGF